jgi:hypothetical protein
LVEIHVENLCIDFKKNDDEIEFFKQNYKKKYSGDEENQCYYDSWQEIKIDVEWLWEYVYWKKKIYVITWKSRKIFVM